jgi:hypothetical protein
MSISYRDFNSAVRSAVDNQDSGTLTLNANNVVAGTGNSTFEYTFNNSPGFYSREIALVYLSTFYSWQNITSVIGNNTFTYVYPSNPSNFTRSVTIPDGTFNISDLNAYLQYVMVANGDYLVDSDGNNRYYLNFSLNAARYAVQLDSYPVPSALPAGWTNPGTALPAADSTPQVTISNYKFATYLGFNESSPASSFPTTSYPAAMQASAYSYLSPVAPQIHPTSCVKVRCDMVARDDWENFPGTIFQFTSGDTAVGATIECKPPELTWYRIMDGKYPKFRITLCDQNDAPLVMKDPQTSITLQHRIIGKAR